MNSREHTALYRQSTIGKACRDKYSYIADDAELVQDTTSQHKSSTKNTSQYHLNLWNL